MALVVIEVRWLVLWVRRDYAEAIESVRFQTNKPGDVRSISSGLAGVVSKYTARTYTLHLSLGSLNRVDSASAPSARTIMRLTASASTSESNLLGL